MYLRDCLNALLVVTDGAENAETLTSDIVLQTLVNVGDSRLYITVTDYLHTNGGYSAKVINAQEFVNKYIDNPLINKPVTDFFIGCSEVNGYAKDIKHLLEHEEYKVCGLFGGKLTPFMILANDLLSIAVVLSIRTTPTDIGELTKFTEGDEYVTDYFNTWVLEEPDK